MRHYVLAMTLATGLDLTGQTRIDLATQGKAVDFSSASSTRPAKTGQDLPPVCAPGEFFFKSNAAPGQNLFLCTAANTWTPVVGSGSSSSGSPAGVAGQLQVNDGGVFGARNPGEGLVLDSLNLFVDPTVVATLADIQTITAAKVFSGTVQISGGGAALDAASAAKTKPVRLIPSPPTGPCEDGEMASRSDGQRYVCVSGVWSGGMVLNQGAAEPACNATNSGLMFLNTSANPSTVKVCGKNSSGAWVWATLNVVGW